MRTLRFYADAGVLPEDGRTPGGYRTFGPDAVARARLVRTLRDLGVGLDQITAVLRAETSLIDVVAAHERALDAQIRLLRLQRGALRAFLASNDHEELDTMTELAMQTAEERRRIVDEYLDAVFGDDLGAVGDKIRMGTPELPDDPSPEQVAAWVELAGLLRDPDYISASRAMAERARAEGPEPDVAQFEVGKAVGELAGPVMRAGMDPSSSDALAVVEQIEAVGGGAPQDRVAAADRIEAFTDRRVARYWTLVGIVNGWPPSAAPDDVIDAWEWYARALRAHA